MNHYGIYTLDQLARMIEKERTELEKHLARLKALQHEIDRRNQNRFDNMR